MLAAYLAQQNSPSPLTGARGAIAGCLAGVVGAFVWLAAALTVDVVMAPLQDRILAGVLQNATDMPPEVRQWLELMSDRTSAPLRFAAGFVFQLLAGVVFATLGGVVATIFFKRPPEAPPAPQAP